MSKQLFSEEDFIKESSKKQKNGGAISLLKKRIRFFLVLLALVVIVVLAYRIVSPATDDNSEEPVLSDTTSLRIQQVINPVEIPKDTVSCPEALPSQSQSKEKENPTSPPTSSGRIEPTDEIEIMAKRTIRGDFGNGGARRKMLGERYQVVQDEVNRLYRVGKLYW